MLIADHSGEPDDEYSTAVDLIGHVDGLALLSPRMSRARLKELTRHNTPVVLVNRVEFGVDLPMIGTDSFTAMLEVCAHLVGLGHRRVVYLSGNELAWQERERWRGIQASRVLGIDVTRVESDGTLETSYDDAEHTLVHDPTAIICFNDLSALGVLSRLRDLGINVPGDISVTGFDDIPIGRHTSPSLTTVRSSREELGRGAWDLLEASLARQPYDEQPVLIPAPLIIRQSTGPVGQQSRSRPTA
jgi:LacI family transcriptional regulator